MFDQRAQYLELPLGLDYSRAPDDNHGPIVNRVIERRACEHDAADVSDRHTDLAARRRRTEHVISCGAVEVDMIADSYVQSRDHARHVVNDKSHMTHQRAIDDRVDRLLVVTGALRIAPQARSGS